MLVAFHGMTLQDAESAIAMHRDESGVSIPQITRFDGYWWLRTLSPLRPRRWRPRPPDVAPPGWDAARATAAPCARGAAALRAAPTDDAAAVASSSTTSGASPAMVAFQMDNCLWLFLSLFGIIHVIVSAS